jgi:hypothetical protein
MLLIEMRSQGSVARRPSHDYIDQLRREGRALFARSTDRHARARFLAADGFFPFWAGGGGQQVSEEMFSDADASAGEALEIAQELDDPNLQSAALDALGGNALGRGDWRKALDLGRRRIAMGGRLALVEQIDAHSVATWSAVMMGDLRTADEVSAAGLAVIQPGQAPDWTMHLVAWRVETLLMVGKWDDAELAVDRLYGLWLESGKPAAGYANRGFAAGSIVAHARRDEPRFRRCSEVIEEIARQFTGSAARILRAIAAWDPDLIAKSLRAERFTYETVALGLSVCTDAGRHLDRPFLEDTLSSAKRANAGLLEAELTRAMGVATADSRLLDEARSRFESYGAMPYVARTRCEAAILRGDRIELDAGLAYLESIRDELQVERYLRAFARNERA